MLNCFHHTVERTGPNDASPRATTPNQSGDSTSRSLRTTIAIVTTIKATFKPVRRRLAVVVSQTRDVAAIAAASVGVPVQEIQLSGCPLSHAITPAK